MQKRMESEKTKEILATSHLGPVNNGFGNEI
jgi:hypothetical protein